MSPTPPKTSLRARLLGPTSQWLLQATLRRPLAERRPRVDWITRTLLLPAQRIERESGTLGGVGADRLRPAGSRPVRRVLYLHGGAYVFGSPATHRPLTGRLARSADAEVVAIDYRLAPEHPFPAAVDDALAAYRALLAEVPASAIVVAGDSAGGGLSLALALSIRDAGLPPPAALALLSPWTDLTLSGASHRERAARERLLTTATLAADARAYAGSADLATPRLSPLFADLRGLPPMLIQVGGEEILFDDSRRLADAAAAAGVPAQLVVYEGLWHVWQLFGGALPEADRAIEALGRFVRDATPGLPTGG